MKRPTSVLLQTGTLALVAVVVAVSICFAVVLGLPPPAPAVTTIGAIASVMSHPNLASDGGYGLVLRQEAPAGPQSLLVARGLAEVAHVPVGSVRAVWQRDTPTAIGRSATGQALLVIAGQDVVINAHTRGFNLKSGEGARLRMDTVLPAFQAALLQPDGRWLVITPPNPALNAWRRRVFLAFVGSGLSVAPVAWFLARRLTRPMRQLADAANQMQLDISSNHVAVGGPREVRDVSVAINAMHTRLATQSADRTRMLTAVAHDLRNPLTGLRLRAEHATPEARVRMVADIDRMTDMIAQVLDYTRGMQSTIPPELFDLSGLIGDCVRESAFRGGEVSWRSPDVPDMVSGDRPGLRRAIDNVIENALRYAGSAEVSLFQKSRSVVIRICDDGPGIPEADLSRLLLPFERLEPSRSRETGGIGLGLTIARDIVAKHAGHLSVRNREQGGLQVEIELPDA